MAMPAMPRMMKRPLILNDRETFENIFCDLSAASGRARFADNGFGWKPSGSGDTITLDASNIASAQWSRASKGYEIKIMLRGQVSNLGGTVLLDGFALEDFERLSKVFKSWYSTNLEHKEHALRGWNWGKGEFGKAELAFNVQNRPAFEIPYTEISNTNLAGKNEVAVEFALPANGDDLTGARGKGKKAGAGKDQLVEMRFYIPGVTTKKEALEDGDLPSDADGEEEQNAANLFYDTLMEKAEIGEVAGDTFATFLDVLHLTPRYVYLILFWTAANTFAEDVSISTCTKTPSAFEARHTTTKFSSSTSKNSWFFQSQMSYTI
jgi:structure-specific recognition protein 1